MIEFRTGTSGLSPDQLEGPFFVGWPNPPDAKTHLRLLEGSDHVVLAVDQATGRVVGYVTAISDGVLSAFIPQLEVLPDYQRRGIGTELVQRLLEEIGDLYAVDAVIDPDVEPFYRHLGMASARAVMLRNYERQSGSA
ncbi:MAG: GNAT family N-acetyltransferase [Acidimicrobiia bacterium]|nr:GNAT family N-acetyltransferase [Acidimicrobiia bacterium]